MTPRQAVELGTSRCFHRHFKAALVTTTADMRLCRHWKQSVREKSLKSKEHKHVYEAFRPFFIIYLYNACFIVSILTPVSSSYKWTICFIPNACVHMPWPLWERQMHIGQTCQSSSPWADGQPSKHKHFQRLWRSRAFMHSDARSGAYLDSVYRALSNRGRIACLSPQWSNHHHLSDRLSNPQQHRRGLNVEEKWKMARHKVGGTQNWDRR